MSNQSRFTTRGTFIKTGYVEARIRNCHLPDPENTAMRVVGNRLYIQSITFSMKLKISYVMKHSSLNISLYCVRPHCREKRFVRFRCFFIVFVRGYNGEIVCTVVWVRRFTLGISLLPKIYQFLRL